MTVTNPNTVTEQDVAEVTALMAELSARWAAQDAVALSQLYSEDAEVALPGGIRVSGRAEIAEKMGHAFDTRWQGTRIYGRPLNLRQVADDVLVLVSEGGAYRAGDTVVDAKDAIRGVWTFVRRDGELTIVHYGNTSIGSPLAMS